MRFAVSTDGLDEALGTLRLLAAKGKNLSQMLDELGQDEKARVLMRFENSTAPDGTRWDELTSRDGQPLMDTGVLYGSITAQVHGNTLQVGTATDYAHYHQFGTQHIPARPFLGVTDDLLTSIKELTHAWFNL